MIEQKVPKMIAIGVHAGLFAQTCWPEELEGLQGAKSCLALGHCHGAAGHWKRKRKNDQRLYIEYHMHKWQVSDSWIHSGGLESGYA